jgi:hypothetical protein
MTRESKSLFGASNLPHFVNFVCRGLLSGVDKRCVHCWRRGVARVFGVGIVHGKLELGSVLF